MKVLALLNLLITWGNKFPYVLNDYFYGLFLTS